MASNFDTEEYEKRKRIADEKGSAASSRKPRNSSFGFFAYGDAPGAIGGGVGVFMWFNSEVALLDYLAEHLTYMNPGRSDTDPFAVHLSVKNVVDRVKTTGSPISKSIPRLNALLKTYSQITWVGTLLDLKEGKSKYCKEIRSAFRGGELGSSPITRSESSDFLGFLAEYGF